MSTEYNINERLKNLIIKGTKVLSTSQSPNPGTLSDDRVDTQLFTEWKTSSLHFLSMVFGSSSIHFLSFQEDCKYSYKGHAVIGLGVLMSAQDDIKCGFLKKMEDLVASDIFTDFIEISEYLISENFYHPAASLLGAVLEDGLRKIAKKNNLTIKNREGVHELSTKLHSAQIFSKLQYKQIDVWREIRNKSDHGRFEEFTIDDVKQMQSGITTFLAHYL